MNLPRMVHKASITKPSVHWLFSMDLALYSLLGAGTEFKNSASWVPVPVCFLSRKMKQTSGHPECVLCWAVKELREEALQENTARDSAFLCVWLTLIAFPLAHGKCWVKDSFRGARRLRWSQVPVEWRHTNGVRTLLKYPWTGIGATGVPGPPPSPAIERDQEL